MEATPRIDAGLSNPLARPALLFGLIVLLISAQVGGVMPPVHLWPFPIWFAVCAVAISFSIVTAHRPGPLHRLQVSLVVGVSLAAMLLLLWNDDGRGPISAYSLGYLAMGVALLILRGHPVVGSVAAVMMLAGIVWLGVRTGAGVLEHLERLAQPLAMIGAFWLLFILTRSIEGRRSRAVAQQLRSVVRTDQASNRRANEQRALSEVPGLAGPLLERIAAGESLTDEFHAELLAADDALRNHIRRDLPYHPGFLHAVDQARGRGVVVQMIGTEDPATPCMHDSLAARLIELLSTNPAVADSAAAGPITAATIRFRSAARGGTTTLLAECAGGARRYEFDAQGNLLGEPS